MPRIVIKNFGPIKNCELSVKDYMVFIGPQASGKSTISKGIYFFKSLRDDLIKYILDSVEKGTLAKPLGTYAKGIRSKFLNYWGSSYHLNDISLKYFYSDDIFIEISLESTHAYIEPLFSDGFKKRFSEIVNRTNKFLEEKRKKETVFFGASELLEMEYERKTFFTALKNLTNELFNDDRDLFFIPAGRSLLATLSEQLQLVNPTKLDYLMTSFVERINNYKSIFTKSLDELVTEKKKLTQDEIDFKNISVAKDIIRRILKGEYKYDRDGEKIYISKDKYTKLNYSSSGQQEVIWILQLMFLLILEKKGVFIVIEEPEAHLFPEAQKEMVDLISLMSNMNNNQVIITTHSPYIISSINNLLYAKKIGMQKCEIVSKRIYSGFWINPENLGAYYINNGSYESIIDDELELLKVELIDSASRMINEEYDFLLDLED